MRVRDLVPYRDFVIETSWSPEVAMRELAKRVDAPLLAMHSIDHDEIDFYGEAVGATAMKLHRKDDFGRQRPPSSTILVSVELAPQSGARVRVQIGKRVDGTVWFTAIAALSSGSLVAALDALTRGEVRFALLAVAIPSAVAAFMLLPFASAAARTETTLRAIFECAPPLPPPEPPYASGDPYR